MVVRLPSKADGHDERSPEGKAVVAKIVITCYGDGAMSVAGNIEDEIYALACLDAAKDTVKSHALRAKLQQRGGLIIPARETPLA